MTPKVRRSFIVRVLQTPVAQRLDSDDHPPVEAHFVVQDLRSGECQTFFTCDELRRFLEHYWTQQLR